MTKRLCNNRGETYIDVAITVMIVAFVLVFSVNMVSLVVLNQNVKTMSDQIVDYATVNGTTDVGDYIIDLKNKTGIDFSYAPVSTGTLQLPIIAEHRNILLRRS